MGAAPCWAPFRRPLIPRGPRAKRRAAAATESAATPARRSTYSSVNGSTAARSSSNRGCVLGHEGVVVEPFGDDEAHHAREQRGVLARLDREVDGGVLGGLGAPGIDHDDVESALHLGAERHQRVRARQLHALHEERLQRVGAHEEHDVGLLDPVEAALPVAVERSGHRLRGLVDGDRRVEGR